MVLTMGGKPKDAPIKYCKYCNKQLERKRFPSGRLECLSAFNKRKYCCWLCMRKDWLTKEKSSQTYRNAHVTAKKINELILQRTECEICGKVGKLDVHHIDGDYQNNDPSNLMVLCRSCHNKEHKKKGKCLICGEPTEGLGYCNKHYIRYKKYGDPLYVSQNSKVDSKGETKIIQLLQDNGVMFIHNKSVFKDCILFTGGVARFDFYINNEYIIEYDSEMHYKCTKSGWYTEKELQVTKQRDREKNEYCWSHNIPIIRIPYWERDNLTLEDLRLETTSFLCTPENINQNN
jgi:hypothetical protein